MKKLLLVLAIGAFAACGDSTTEESTTTDTIGTSTVDSTTLAPAPDTTVVVTDTTKVDSAAKK